MHDDENETCTLLLLTKQTTSSMERAFPFRLSLLLDDMVASKIV